MLKFLFKLIMLLILIAAAITFYGAQLFTQPGSLSDTKLVVVPRGTGIVQTAEMLERETVINNRWVFIAAAVATNKKSSIKAGEYEFTPAVPMAEVLAKLARGDVFKRAVTIREGLTSYQVIEWINKAKKLEGVLSDIPAEGTLLPETYNYAAGDTRAALVARMQKDMTATIEELWPKRAADLPLKTPQEAIILASIVEKETGVADERKRVAGVFINRLKLGMKLQTDPTVIYALTKGKPEDDGQGPLGRRLLRKDLETTDSPYNTYMYAGLPPGPIANPGRLSIEAVLNPEPHEFLFFVADGKGGHVFSKGAKEHERNVVEWRKIRAQSAKKN